MVDLTDLIAACETEFSDLAWLLRSVDPGGEVYVNGGSHFAHIFDRHITVDKNGNEQSRFSHFGVGNTPAEAFEKALNSARSAVAAD